ncbi:unnamed protein product [Notodromas monacha]|uniref:Serine/threonine-protein phosphatase 4 regulatory subunit 3-like central domain-containing protein n=1 Tax=Notodromas monacha TaxID=399045 RepID=A0A7R9BP65_9CRUS|nr:unnamed protein product [Notodromas monacha]CAG0918241.1 unnamed protein product [Notodromas monacha]
MNSSARREFRRIKSRKSSGGRLFYTGTCKKDAMPAHETRRRVKLYALNAEKQWDDKGTGHVASSYVDRLKGYSLLVRAEVDGSILLESKIQPDTTYQKQQETLIVWSEGENYDLALSFQERAGCDEIWEKICQVQGRDPSADTTQEIVDESEDERFSEENELLSSADTTFNITSLDLPPPDVPRLEEIDEVRRTYCLSAPVRREKLAMVLESEDYLRRLLSLFTVCEDKKDTDALHHLYAIVKNIFLMNRTTLIEMLLHDDMVFDVIGCLEYDPSNKGDRRKHREYLKLGVNFRQIVPTVNKELNAKIHQTYRAQYLHDVALPTPSFFEDSTSTLSSFIFFNKVDIVNMVQKDEQFLRQIFSELTEEETEIGRRRDLILFLKELSTFSQTLQPINRESLLKQLSSFGILPALEIAMCLENQFVVRTAATDILNMLVEFSPSIVREYILNQAGHVEEDQLFSNVLIEVMMCDPDPDLSSAAQLQSILKILLDPENMLAAMNKSEKSDFLSYFYKHSMHVLTAPLLLHTSEDKPGKDDAHTANLLSLIVELLGFCVDHHTFHIKNYIIGKDLLRRVLVLLKSSHKHLALSALRLMRKIIGLKDTFYHNHIIEKSLFKPVVEALLQNKGRYNLLDSAILELFEFTKTDVTLLFSHVVEKYGKELEVVNYAPTFRDMRKKCEEKLSDRIDRTLFGKNVGRFRRDPREPDEDEALWFDADEEDEPEPMPPANEVAPCITAKNEDGPCLVVTGSPTLTSSGTSSLGQVGPSAVPSFLAALNVDRPLSPDSREPTDGGHGLLAAHKSLLPGATSLLLLSDESVVKPSLFLAMLVSERGLVDYEGDSDDEETERDDGDADCEEEEEEEEEDEEEETEEDAEAETKPENPDESKKTPVALEDKVNGSEEKVSSPQPAKDAEVDDSAQKVASTTANDISSDAVESATAVKPEEEEKPVIGNAEPAAVETVPEIESAASEEEPPKAEEETEKPVVEEEGEEKEEVETEKVVEKSPEEEVKKEEENSVIEKMEVEEEEVEEKKQEPEEIAQENQDPEKTTLSSSDEVTSVVEKSPPPPDRTGCKRSRSEPEDEPVEVTTQAETEDSPPPAEADAKRPRTE